ncbi:MAG: AraC family transcriptional regulator [Salinimicrobium sp.]
MKISVKALPIKEVIEDLAKAFEVEVENDNTELTINIPERLGKGFIRGSNFRSGIGIVQYKCTFYQDVEIHFTSEKTHPLKFIFCTEGRVAHSFAHHDEKHEIDTYQNIIVSSHANNGHVLFFTANQVANVSSLEIIRKQFSDYITYNFNDLEPRLKEVLEDSESETQFLYHGNYSITSAEIVEQIQDKDLSGFLRTIFLEGKIFEMLSKQINQYQDDQSSEKPQIMRRSDVEKVKRAVNTIEENLNQNYSVDYLAKEVGTNVNKLQEGFKYMFDLTVNKYMQQVKLEAAKDMLTNSENNISQIVSQIGFNNRSYFSKIFKEKYGVSPKHFLKKRNNAEENSLDYFSEEDK